MRDVRHDSQREDRESLERAAGKQVDHVEHGPLGLAEILPERLSVDAGRRDRDADAIDGQHQQGEPRRRRSSGIRGRF